MTFVYRTPAAFFVSPAGKRLQKRIRSFFDDTELQGQHCIFFGFIFPFLTAFEQNAPEILWEQESIVESGFFSSLPTASGIDSIFISVLNNSVSDNLPLLIKEAEHLLKPQGRLFILSKNKTAASVTINGMPEIKTSFLLNELRKNDFELQKKKSLLYFPYNAPFWERADKFLSVLPFGGGTFSILSARKAPLIPSGIKDYKSTRITKASVFTSPRT
ncbi:MAG: hypothetical protein IKR09_07580 [Alphaproteobacteria bacterium]|nr:hypothetical protein [Alphaproteobacteria bacterium]